MSSGVNGTRSVDAATKDTVTEARGQRAATISTSSGNSAWFSSQNTKFSRRVSGVRAISSMPSSVLAKVPGPASSPSQRWICLSADGERLLVAGCPAQGTEMALWSVAGPRRLATLHVDRTIRKALFLPDGSIAMWLDPEEVPGAPDAGALV